MTTSVQRVTMATGNGVRLVADVEGAERAPAVILLHGGGQTRHSWSGAMQALVAEGYRVINYDARGHGESDWANPPAYSLDDRAEDLASFAAIAGDRFAVVGASLGGATAIHAVARGLRPQALILVDIVPHPEQAGIDRIVNFMRSHPNGFLTLEEAGDAVATYNPQRARSADINGLRRNLRLGTDGRLRWHWDPSILEAQPDAHRSTILESAKTLAGIETLPTLLVRGLQSDVVSDDGVAAFARMMPRLEVFDVAQAGHMLVGDRNDVFNSGIIAYLRRNLVLEGDR